MDTQLTTGYWGGSEEVVLEAASQKRGLALLWEDAAFYLVDELVTTRGVQPDAPVSAILC